MLGTPIKLRGSSLKRLKLTFEEDRIMPESMDAGSKLDNSMKRKAKYLMVLSRMPLDRKNIRL